MMIFMFLGKPASKCSHCWWKKEVNPWMEEPVNVLLKTRVCVSCGSDLCLTFRRNFFQTCFSSAIQLGCLVCRALLRSFHSISVGFRYGLWLQNVLCNHSVTDLHWCLGLLICRFTQVLLSFIILHYPVGYGDKLGNSPIFSSSSFPVSASSVVSCHDHAACSGFCVW